MVGITRIPWAALEDVGLTYRTLLMPMNDNSIQRWLTSRASLSVTIGWVEKIIH